MKIRHRIYTYLQIVFGTLLFALSSSVYATSSIKEIDDLNSLAWKLQHQNPLKADSILQHTIELCEGMNYSFGKAKALSHLGTLSNNKGNYGQAYGNFRTAIAIFRGTEEANEIAKCYSKIAGVFYKEGKADSAISNYEKALDNFTLPVGIANTHNNLALVYQSQANYSKAIASFINAAESFKTLNKQALLGATYNNIGLMYSNQKEYEKAEKYYKDALAIAETLKSPNLLAQSLVNVGTSLANRNENEAAIEMYLSASKIFTSSGQQAKNAVVNNNIAVCQKSLGRKKEAIQNYKSALHIFNSLGNPKEEAATLNNIASIYQEENNLDSALLFFLEAFEKGKISNDLHILVRVSENLSILYQNLQKHKESLQYHTLYAKLNDSLLNAQNDQLENANEEKYQNKMQTEIINDQKSVIAWSIAGSLFLGIIAFVLYYFFRDSSNKASKLSNEKAFIELKKNELETTLSKKEGLLEKLQERAVYKQESLPPHFSKLSKREVEVLLLLGEGMSDKKIADKLFISVTTARTHLRRIYSKLLIKSRAEAVNIVHKYDISSLQS